LNEIEELGQRLRKVRESKKITLRGLARTIGVTPSLLSQIENGKVSPSLSTLRKILDALGETLFSIFQDNEKIENMYVIRKDERKKIIVSKALHYEVLTTKNDSITMFIVYLEPGEGSGEDFYVHKGIEAGLILQGRMEITIGDKVFVLEKGDSITYPSNVPHRWRNIGKEKAIGIWVVSPPSF